MITDEAELLPILKRGPSNQVTRVSVGIAEDQIEDRGIEQSPQMDSAPFMRAWETMTVGLSTCSQGLHDG